MKKEEIGAARRRTIDQFSALNLAKVFRAKFLDGIKGLGLKAKETRPEEWLVHCKAVGRGDQALIYLGG
jgi:hypothetical protein